MCYVSGNNCLQIVPTTIITLVHLMSSKLGLINAKIIIIMIMMMTIIIFIRNLIVITTTMIKTIITIIIHTADIFVHQPLGLFQAFSQQSAGEKFTKKKKTTSLYYLNAWNWVFVHTQYYTQSADFTQHSEHSLSIPEQTIQYGVIVIKQLPVTLIKVVMNFVGSFGCGRNLWRLTFLSEIVN